MPLTNTQKQRRYRARKRGEVVEPLPRGGPRSMTVTPGQVVGKLTVIREGPPKRYGRHVTRQAECACSCGTVKLIRLDELAGISPRGSTVSCGCYRAEQSSQRAKARKTWVSHGVSQHPLFDTWRRMIKRCGDPADKDYAGYGGRGITVCPEWHDPVAFLAWIEANIGPRPDGGTQGKRKTPAYTLDRINNDRGYGPGNVQWATRAQQAANRRKVTVLTRERDALTAEVAELRQQLASRNHQAAPSA